LLLHSSFSWGILVFLVSVRFVGLASIMPKFSYYYCSWWLRCSNFCSHYVTVTWLWHVHCQKWRGDPHWTPVCWMLWQHGECSEGVHPGSCGNNDDSWRDLVAT
jgi:hypothetical protein